MTFERFDGKKVRIKDCDGEVWEVLVDGYSFAADNDNNENEILVLINGGLVSFYESEIAEIEVIE